MSIKSFMLSNHLILCHPFLLLPAAFPRIRVFSIESDLHIRWLKFWSFSFSISPSSEYWGLVSFSIDWFNLLAGKGTLENLLQHHSSKASLLQCSALFMVQLSHLYITTEKTIALTVWNLSEKSCHEQHSQFLIRNPWCQMHPENHTFWEPSKIVSDKIVPQQDQNSSVQLLSRVWLFVTPRITARQASFHHQLPEFTKTRVHRVGDAI